MFASELGSENNAQTVSLIKEVAALSDKIAVKVLNPHIERDETAAYGVSVTPAVAVEGTKDYGIRFLGVPARLRVLQPDRFHHRGVTRRGAAQGRDEDGPGRP